MAHLAADDGDCEARLTLAARALLEDSLDEAMQGLLTPTTLMQEPGGTARSRRPSLRGTLIRTKLSLAIISHGLALLALLGVQYWSARGDLLDTLRAEASLTAGHLIQVVGARDAAAAENLLRQLEHRPDVLAAAVYLADGSVLAAHARPGQARPL